MKGHKSILTRFSSSVERSYIMNLLSQFFKWPFKKTTMCLLSKWVSTWGTGISTSHSVWVKFPCLQFSLTAYELQFKGMKLEWTWINNWQQRVSPVSTATGSWFCAQALEPIFRNIGSILQTEQIQKNKYLLQHQQRPLLCACIDMKTIY